MRFTEKYYQVKLSLSYRCLTAEWQYKKTQEVKLRTLSHMALTSIAMTIISANAYGVDITVNSLTASGISSLSSTELTNIIVGNTLIHKSQSSQEVIIYYRNDGNRVFKMGARRFEGPYEIKDNRRCESSNQGGSVCMTIYKAEGGQYIVCDPRDGGRCIWTVTVEKGNSRGLQ